MDFYMIFPKVLNMSLTGSIVILVVLLLRLCLKRMPKYLSYGLWAVVLFRLLCPVSISLDFSLLGLFDAPAEAATELTTTVSYIPEDIVHTEYPQVQLPVQAVSNAINEPLPQGQEQLRADPLEAPVSIATFIWIAGMTAMVLYGICSYVSLKLKLIGSVGLRENIYLSDHISSPFVIGLVFPKIYLPSTLEQDEQGYIILHEQYHISRGDHIIKLLSFLALTIHWFNPLVWVAFALSGKDMEMRCDEAVIMTLGEDIMGKYAASMLSLATGHRLYTGMPLAFGEGDTKSRIKNLSEWKRPTILTTIAVSLICIAVVIVCAVNPREKSTDPFGHPYRVSEILYAAPQFSFTYTPETAPLYTLNADYALDILEDKDTENWLRPGVFDEVRLNKDNFDTLFFPEYENLGWADREMTAETIRKNCRKAWSLRVGDAAGQESGETVLYYVLLQKDGSVYLAWGNYDHSGENSYIRWLFNLARTDLLMVHVNSEGMGSSSVFPWFYPEGFDYNYQGIPTYTFNGTGNMVFFPGWETESLEVGVDHYTSKNQAGTVDRKSYWLLPEESGTFSLELSREGTGEEYAIIFVTGESGTFVFRVDFAEAGSIVIQDIIAGEPYVSWQCRYMTPYSSYSSFGGDSGSIYLLSDNGFTKIDRSSGVVFSASLLNPEWQDIPWTEEEWQELFAFTILGAGEEIGMFSLPEDSMYRSISDEYCLLKPGGQLEGELWLVEFAKNEEMGKHIYSIYSLVPESQMGSAQWEFMPYSSAVYPAFPIEFDFDYDEISAVCTESLLVDIQKQTDGVVLTMKESNEITYASECDLYWTPNDGKGNQVMSAAIRFTAKNGTEQICAGTIYITGQKAKDGLSTAYTAKLVGTGLKMTQSDKGAVISFQTG